MNRSTVAIAPAFGFQVDACDSATYDETSIDLIIQRRDEWVGGAFPDWPPPGLLRLDFIPLPKEGPAVVIVTSTSEPQLRRQREIPVDLPACEGTPNVG